VLVSFGWSGDDAADAPSDTSATTAASGAGRPTARVVTDWSPNQEATLLQGSSQVMRMARPPEKISDATMRPQVPACPQRFCTTPMPTPMTGAVAAQ
jgi:hypothetical protein